MTKFEEVPCSLATVSGCTEVKSGSTYICRMADPKPAVFCHTNILIITSYPTFSTASAS